MGLCSQNSSSILIPSTRPQSSYLISIILKSKEMELVTESIVELFRELN